MEFLVRRIRRFNERINLDVNIREGRKIVNNRDSFASQIR